MNILIVEDDRVLSLMLTRMVQRIGHEVLGSVSRGEDAIQLATAKKVDLILMDIMLDGEIDGIEAMKEIRENSDVPVIYVTGNSDKSTIERAKETNYIEYLVKPIGFKQLEGAISKVS